MIPPSYLFRPIYDRAWTAPDLDPVPAREGSGPGPLRRAASLARRLLQGLAPPAPADRASAP